METARAPVERFFQFSLLGLVASGYLAIAGSGYVDAITVALAGSGLLWRTLIVSGVRGIQVPEKIVTLITIAYMAFAPVDYFLLSKSWIPATVHVVFFVAGIKILTARAGRDYLFVAAVAFIELLAAALFSASGMFFLCLAAYLLFAVAALTSAEVRRMNTRDSLVADSSRLRAPARLAGLASAMTVGILLLTAGLFFLLPRTANATLRFLATNHYHLTGFSDDVTLGAFGELKSDARPVLHVKSLSAGAAGGFGDLPLNGKWRGFALEVFDGHRWSTDPNAFRSVPPDRSGLVKLADDAQRRRPGRRILYRVESQNVDSDAIFVAGTPEFLSAGRTRVLRAPNGALRSEYAVGDNVHYEVYSFLPPSEGASETQATAGATAAGARSETLTGSDRARHLQLPPIDGRVAALAREMTHNARDDGERARAIEQRLRKDYGYSLDLPSTPPRDPIAYFLFERRAGYCEYFASAMTVMLRSLKIPARLVNGFQSGVPNPYSGTLVIRASDAHTWVEAYLPGAGWTVFDPTPLAGRVPMQTFWSKLALYLDAADTFWREWVMGYDFGQQITLASRLQTRVQALSRERFLPRVREWAKRASAALKNRSIWITAAWIFEGLISLALSVALARRFRWTFSARRARANNLAPQDATAVYLRMLRLMNRRGHHKPDWFTPQEFADLARNDWNLDTFTSAYYALRFGGKAEASRELWGALERLQSASK